MRFCLALLIVSVAHLAHAQETALSPACTAELNWLKGAAQTLAVAIEAPPGLRVGDKLHVRWGGGQGLAGTSPVALILAMPDSVRFEGRYSSEQQKDKDGEVLQDGIYGPDFLAFPPRSVDPFGLRHGNDRMRAVVPLHVSGSRASELWIKPLRAQPLDIQWALVARTACGERLIRSDEAVRLSVGLGRPEIVVQDATVSLGSRLKGSAAAADEKPGKVIASSSGQYIVLEYKHNYRVFEAASGALLLDGPGYAPSFSPTSRFLAARTGGASDSQSQVEIFDLLAGQQIALVTAPILGWSHADALIYAGHTELRTLSVASSLIDELNDKEPTNGLVFQGVSGSGRDMDAWNYLNFLVRADQGIIAFKDQGLSDRPGILNLYDGRMAELDGATQWIAALDRDHGIAAGDALLGWQSSPPIGLTHTCASCDRDDVRRFVKKQFDNNRSRPTQRSALVLRNEVARAGAGTRAAPGVERSAWKRTGSPDGAAADDLEARLGEFGLPLGPHTNVASGTFDRLGSGLDYARKWPADVASRLKRELGFQTHGDAGFIVGHWAIPYQGKVVHIVQNGRFPEAGWEYPFVEMATFDERDGRLGNLRLHHALNGANEAGLPGAVHKHWGSQKVALRVTDLGNGTVALGWPATGSIGLLSLGDGSLRIVKDAPQSDLMRFNALTSDRRHLVQVNHDGRFFVYRVGSGKRILSGRAIDGEFIVHDENGYYAATYEGAHFVHMRFPGEAGLHSFHQFASRLNRPDLVAKVIADDAATVPAPALTTPPTIGLALRKSPGGAVAAVQARAGDSLKAIRLYQDGQLTQEVEATGRDAALDIGLVRVGRARWVTAVAVDRSGMLSQPATAQLDDAADAPGGALLGVTVGVDRYHNARTFPNLELAVKDARDMAAVLKDKRAAYYAHSEVRSLTDDQATPPSVLAAVNDATGRAKAGDTVVFFYAGHGVRGRDGRYYLASPAASLADLAGTAIAWADVAQALQRSRARVVVYLDACHSALAGEAFASNDDAIAQIMSGAQAPMLVLAASKGRQFGEEMQGLGNGVFTHAVRRVLRADRSRHDTNRNGLIELSELYDGVRTIVAGLTKGRQTPWLVRSDLIGDFAVH